MLAAIYTGIAIVFCLKYPKLVLFLVLLVFVLSFLGPGFACMYDALGFSGMTVFGLIFCIAPGCLLGYGLVLLQRRIGKWYYKQHPELPKPSWWKEEYNK